MPWVMSATLAVAHIGGFRVLWLGAVNNNLGFVVNWSEPNSDTLQTFLNAGEGQVVANVTTTRSF
jgi:porin